MTRNDESLARFTCKSFFSWTPETESETATFQGYAQPPKKTGYTQLSAKMIQKARSDREFVNSLLGSK